MIKRALFLPLFLAVLTLPAQASESNPLYEQLSRAKEVKVYVAVPTDPSGTKLDTEAFRKAIEQALRDRKSIHFAPVASESEAILVVDSELKGFGFSLTDPVDMLAGVGMAAMDAAKVEHFASVDAKMTVREPSGAVKWTDTIHASITDPAITETESREKILPRAAEYFVRTAFGKRK